MKGKFMLICHDPPYHVLDVERDESQSYTLLDMERTVLHSTNLLHKSGTLIIFCSFEQHSIYLSICEKNGLFVDKLPLLLIKSPNSYFTNLFIDRKAFNLSSTMRNCAECAVVAHKTGSATGFFWNRSVKIIILNSGPSKLLWWKILSN
jgi:hypothetical protein